MVIIRADKVIEVSNSANNSYDFHDIIRNMNNKFEKQFVELQEAFEGQKTESDTLNSIFKEASRKFFNAYDMTLSELEVKVISDLNDNSYKDYYEHCLTFKSVNVAELSTNTTLFDRCFYDLKSLIQNTLTLVLQAHPKEQLEIIINALDNCIRDLKKNNFRKIADDKLTESKAQIANENKKLKDAHWKLGPINFYTDDDAVADANKKKEDLEGKIRNWNLVLNNLKSLEYWTEEVKQNMTVVFEDSALSLKSMNKTLESKLKWVDDYYSKLSENVDMTKELQERIYDEPKNWVNNIYEMRYTIFKISNPLDIKNYFH